MRSVVSQRTIQRAIRAAHNAGMPPSSAKIHPDGTIVLCFGESKVSADDGLDREMDQWRRNNATN
jgi:hypothetical protein